MEVEAGQPGRVHRFGEGAARDVVALTGLIEPLDSHGEQCDEHGARLDEAHLVGLRRRRARLGEIFAAVLSLRLLEVLKTRFFSSSQKMHNADKLSTTASDI